MLRHKKWIALAATVVTLVVLAAAGVLPHPPDAQKLIEDLASGLGQWTYVLVGALAFLETGAFVGLIAPGETAVMLGGVIAGQGEISIVPLVGLVWLCCVLGDTTSFFVGRRLGRGFLLRHGPKFKVDEQRLAHVESYFERHGGKTILIGRFIGLVRAVSPFVAGSSGLRYRRFIPFSVTGCGLWATLYCVLGYIFYRSFDRITAVAGKATLAFAVTVGVIVGAVYAWRKLRSEEGRRAAADWFERQGRRPALRPLAALLSPLWRRAFAPAFGFVGPRVRAMRARLAPGHLIVQLTSVLAVAAAGTYFFVVYATIVSDDPGATPEDRELADMARDLRARGAVEVAKLVTQLGSPVTVATVAVCVGLLLLARRHVTEAIAFIAGSALVYLAVRLAKDGFVRPRPGGALISAAGSSFPSGHAAYSTIWVAAAIALAWCIPGVARRTLLIAAALAVAVAVGLTRIYLRVHYWSDVAAGWGLGAAILGACAAAALTVVLIRQNAHGRASSDPASGAP